MNVLIYVSKAPLLESEIHGYMESVDQILTVELCASSALNFFWVTLGLLPE